MSGSGGRRTRAERAALATRMRAEQQAAEHRRRRLWITGSVVIAVVLIVVAYVVISRSTSGVSKSNVAEPAHATADGGFELDGPPTADDVPRVIVYVDFMCPICRQFEADAGSWMDDEASEGGIVLEYRTVAFLDGASTTDYSTRAANAAACVADQAGVEAFVTMRDALFAGQPVEGGPGLSDDTLTDMAVQAGSDEDDVSSCVDGGTFGDWVAQTTDRASDDGVSGTPTVTVDGTQVTPGSAPTLDALKEAVGAVS